MDDFRLAVLALVGANDWAWSWYQLDHALTQRAPSWDLGIVVTELMPALRSLEAEGLIVSEVGHSSSQLRYRLTPAGSCLMDAPKA